MSSWSVAILLVTTLQACYGTYVQFYEEPNYNKFVTEVDLTSENANDCISLNPNDPKDVKLVSSVKTDRCLILYGTSNCQLPKFPDSMEGSWGDILRPMYSRRVDASEKDLWDHYVDKWMTTKQPMRVASFHVCSQSRAGGPQVDIDIYEKQGYEGKIIAQYKNLCGCHNVPASMIFGSKNYPPVSIDNHGSSIEFFEEEECRGYSRVTVAGHNYDSMISFQRGPQMDARSFRPTAESEGCLSMDASIYKFVFRNGTSNTPVGTEDVKLAADTVMRANGKAKLVQEYSVTSKVAETLDITTSTSYSNMHTAGVDTSYEAEVEGGVPFVAKGKSKWKVGLSYKYQRTDGGSKTNRTSIVNEETIGIRQNIEVSPCTECKISSFIKKAKGFPIEYTAYARVRGTYGNRPMTTEELKSHLLPGNDYIGDDDANTIKTVVKGVMYAEYGVSAFINADCLPIPDCAVQGESVAPTPKRYTMQVKLQ